VASREGLRRGTNIVRVHFRAFFSRAYDQVRMARSPVPICAPVPSQRACPSAGWPLADGLKTSPSCGRSTQRGPLPSMPSPPSIWQTDGGAERDFLLALTRRPDFLRSDRGFPLGGSKTSSLRTRHIIGLRHAHVSQARCVLFRRRAQGLGAPSGKSRSDRRESGSFAGGAHIGIRSAPPSV